MNKKNNIWSIPFSWISGGAKLGDFFYLALNSERLQKLTEDYAVSNEEIVKAIGKTMPVYAGEGLIKYVCRLEN